ncbi:MAG: peptidyl-alpha-hydroxyglycine alpha-amidating lyase family protein [Planctomycetaceae bacterium]
MSRSRFSPAFLALGFLCGGLWTSLYAQTAEEKAPEIPPPNYPKVDPAPWYEVDPAWPQKPAEFQWEAMPGIAVDAKDQVWIFTRSTPPIQVYTQQGKFVKSWGDDTIETAHHLKIDKDGNIWVADIGLHIIRQFTPEGEILRTIGTPGVPGEDKTHLNKPTDMAITPDGQVFVSDGYGNNRIVHFDANDNYVKEWGGLGIGRNEFSLPHAIDIDSKGRLYVADRNNARVQIYSQQGKLIDSWQNVVVPWGFWVKHGSNGADDEIWVCGCSPMPWLEHPDYPGAPLSCPPKDQLIMKFATNGRLQQLWTIPKGTDGEEQPGDVNWLHCLALDSDGNVYLGDIIGKRAQKFVLRQRK